jgi:hypothetical protein
METYHYFTEVYGDVMRVQSVRKWRREFENGRTGVHDDGRSGQHRNLSGGTDFGFRTSHMGGRLIYINEEVEMALCEWLRWNLQTCAVMGQMDHCVQGFFRTISMLRWNE